MTRALQHRLDRLTERIAVGRMIVVEIAHVPPPVSETPDCDYAASGSLSI